MNNKKIDTQRYCAQLNINCWDETFVPLGKYEYHRSGQYQVEKDRDDRVSREEEL